MPYYVCSRAEEQTCLDNNVLGLLSNVEWFATQPNVFSPGLSRTAQNTLYTSHCIVASVGSRFFPLTQSPPTIRTP
ncbi:hypothetical protein T07_12540 [Trichinella nelsoni]|uniref:Uncharacterized protein n=1 Tax=Trichinella nelsoni TaxID=6336 RepID=A0A0V0RZL9_9BILA|nr:hypothetical protein T07_12540 [Trichinella nelsoni]